MQLGKVTGTIVATRKDEGLAGMKLLMIQLLDIKGKVQPSYTVAVDAIGCGVGEVVLVVAGSSARMATMALNKPVDASIIAVVDSVEVAQKTVYNKAEAEAGVGSSGG